MTRGWHKEPLRHSMASKGIKTSFGKSQVRKQLNIPPARFKLASKDYSKENIDEIFMLFWWCNKTGEWQWFNFDKGFEIVSDILYKKLGEHFYLPPDEQREYLEELWQEDEYLRDRTWSFMTYYMKNHQEEAKEIYDEFMNVKFLDELKEIYKHFYLDSWQIQDADDVEDLYPDWSESWWEFRGFEHEFGDLMDENKEFRDKLFKTLSEWDIDPDDLPRDDLLRCEKGIYDSIQKYWKDMTSTKRKRNRLEENIVLFDSVIDMIHHTGKIFDDILLENTCYLVDELRNEFEEEYT